jgi:hypothetical protein
MLYCWIARRSPWAAAFPPLPPLKVSPLCSAVSSVLFGSPTPPVRACLHCGFAPSQTGLPLRQTDGRSPGSRACCFSTCQGLRPRRVPLRLAILRLRGCCLPTKQTGSAHGSSVFGPQCPAHRCLCLRFAVRLATHHARLKVGIESLLLSRRALSSPTTCRFIPAHLLASIAAE